MAFRKTIFAKTFNLFEAALGKIALIATRHHAIDKAQPELMNNAGFAKGRHSAAQAVGLGGGKACRNNGNAHGLLLKQWHAQRLAQHFFQFLRRKGDRFLAIAAAQIGMHHIALYRAGADNRHFDHQIVKVTRLQARQHVHLRTAFNLKNTDGFGAAQHVINRAILRRHIGQLKNLAVMRRDKVKAAAYRRQHAERQHIDFQHAEHVQIVFIPFDEGAVIHRRIADRHQRVQPLIGNHKTADMLRQVTRKADKLTGQRQSGGNTRRVRVKPRLNDMFTRRRLATATPIQGQQRAGNIARQPHDFRHFTHR